jgi:hypothetical protein
MKFASYLVLLLTILSAISTRHRRRSRNGDVTPVYSMVVSAKHYNKGAEKKDFFFAVPVSFNCQMKKNDKLGTFEIGFTTSNADAGNMKAITEASLKMNAGKKKWQDVIQLQNDNKQLIVHYSPDPSKYTVERIKVYQNQTFHDIQIKFVKIGDAKKHALYVTFDFKKENDKDEQFGKFIEFWKKNFPKATVVGSLARSKKLNHRRRFK